MHWCVCQKLCSLGRMQWPPEPRGDICASSLDTRFLNGSFELMPASVNGMCGPLSELFIVPNERTQKKSICKTSNSLCE